MRLSEIANEKAESEGQIKVEISFRINMNGIISSDWEREEIIQQSQEYSSLYQQKLEKNAPALQALE